MSDKKITITEIKNFFSDKEVKEALCKLTTEVAGIVYKPHATADCFCGSKVIRFIQEAVQEKINKDIS
jgi:hypothetical protein